MNDEQKALYKEIEKYNSEYKKAIKKLMELDNINEVLSPVTALIMQYIENHLKAILQDFFEIEETAHTLKIDNHKSLELVQGVRNKYTKYLNINSVNNQLLRIEECINYLEGIYGDNTMINARYPIDKYVLKINRKQHTIISEQYKLMFTILRLAIENLIDFYELEKTYQKIIKTSNAKEQLQDFIEFCNKEYNKPQSIIKIATIKEIDKCNENILNT